MAAESLIFSVRRGRQRGEMMRRGRLGRAYSGVGLVGAVRGRNRGPLSTGLQRPTPGPSAMSISWCRRRLTSGRRQHGKERRASPRQPFELRDENIKFQAEWTIAKHRSLKVNQPSARNPTAHLELIPALAGSWKQMKGGALVGRRGASARPYSTAGP